MVYLLTAEAHDLCGNGPFIENGARAMGRPESGMRRVSTGLPPDDMAQAPARGFLHQKGASQMFLLHKKTLGIDGTTDKVGKGQLFLSGL